LLRPARDQIGSSGEESSRRHSRRHSKKPADSHMSDSTALEFSLSGFRTHCPRSGRTSDKISLLGGQVPVAATDPYPARSLPLSSLPFDAVFGSVGSSRMRPSTPGAAPPPSRPGCSYRARSSNGSVDAETASRWRVARGRSPARAWIWPRGLAGGRDPREDHQPARRREPR